MHASAHITQHDETPVLKAELPYVVFWRGRVHVSPSIEVLSRWAMFGGSETPAGEPCELDHPDSWLVLVGLL